MDHIWPRGAASWVGPLYNISVGVLVFPTAREGSGRCGSYLFSPAGGRSAARDTNTLCSSYAGVSVRWLTLRGCHSLGSRLTVFSHPDQAFLDVSPSWWLSLPGERRQRRPGSKTWRLAVLAEGVSCRTVGSFSLYPVFLPLVKKQWKVDRTGLRVSACRLANKISAVAAVFGRLFSSVVVKSRI